MYQNCHSGSKRERRCNSLWVQLLYCTNCTIKPLLTTSLVTYLVSWSGLRQCLPWFLRELDRCEWYSHIRCRNFVNTEPFKRVFGNWFLTGSNKDHPTLPPFPHEDLNHLDTDIVLAFPPQSTTAHPNYSVHTHQFASNNTHFLSTFFNALHKMSTLGVNTSLLSPATECKDLCNPTGARKLATAYNTGMCYSELLFKMLS